MPPPARGRRDPSRVGGVEVLRTGDQPVAVTYRWAPVHGV